MVPDINADLYKAYDENFIKAVSSVLGDSEEYSDIKTRLEANVSRFAAYKAYHATKELSNLEADELDTKGSA